MNYKPWKGFSLWLLPIFPILYFFGNEAAAVWAFFGFVIALFWSIGGQK